MRVEKLPGVAIRVGLLLVILGFFRSTTVDTSWGAVHNIGLLEQKFSLMFLGAILFIGGLIWKSITQEKSSKSTNSDAQGKANNELPQTKEEVSQLFEPIRSSYQRILSALNGFRDRFFVRLIVAIGMPFALIGSMSLYMYALPFFLILFLALSMRRIPSYVALRKSCFTALWFSVIGFSFFFVLGFSSGSRDILDIMTYIGLISNALIFFGYYKFKKLSA